jgi:hypothetical protein
LLDICTKEASSHLIKDLEKKHQTSKESKSEITKYYLENHLNFFISISDTYETIRDISHYCSLIEVNDNYDVHRLLGYHFKNYSIYLDIFHGHLKTQLIKLGNLYNSYTFYNTFLPVKEKLITTIDEYFNPYKNDIRNPLMHPVLPQITLTHIDKLGDIKAKIDENNNNYSLVHKAQYKSLFDSTAKSYCDLINDMLMKLIDIIEDYYSSLNSVIIQNGKLIVTWDLEKKN